VNSKISLQFQKNLHTIISMSQRVYHYRTTKSWFYYLWKYLYESL